MTATWSLPRRLACRPSSCITKIDLAQDENGQLNAELAEVAAEYRRIGYPVLLVSAHLGQGLAEVQQALDGRISVLLGKSGVGKTSLLNALQPDLGLRVNAVNQVTGKGKHTTTNMEMFPLEFGRGGGIIDTPGVREFGLWLEEGAAVDWFFPEMRPLPWGMPLWAGLPRMIRSPAVQCGRQSPPARSIHAAGKATCCCGAKRNIPTTREDCSNSEMKRLISSIINYVPGQYQAKGCPQRVTTRQMSEIPDLPPVELTANGKNTPARS